MQKIVITSLFLTGVTGSVSAQTNPTDDAIELSGTVVTATRSKAARNTLAAGNTVYTREDIDRLQVKSLPELFRGTTGMDVVQSGGYGQASSVFMRGSNSQHVLVLIDGIKVGSAAAGLTQFELLPMDQIERVEIIRGPLSSLYGSEAIGGVIQIFTRKGKQTERPSVNLTAGGGNYYTMQGSGNVSGRWQNTWYNVGASHFNTQGFSSTQPTPGPFGVNQPDHDGYYNTAVNARVGHHFDNNAEVEATYMRSSGRTEFDGLFQNKTIFANQVASLTGSVNFMKNWRSTLRLGQSFDHGDNYAPSGAYSSRFDTTRWNQTWLNDVNINDNHKLVIGQDFRLDQIDSTTPFTKTSRYDVGGFVQYSGHYFNDHFINASIRGDENQAFGSYVTGNFSWRYNSPIGISPFASFGNAFKAPNFNELYWPYDGYFKGNPNLKPEQSTSFEAGVAGNHDWLQWELRAYHTNIDNLISTVLVDPNTYQYRPLNVNKAQIDGIEAELTSQLWGWTGKLSMNLLSPVDRISNAQLPRRAKQTLSFNLSRSFGAVDVGAFVLAQGHRYDDPANTIKVAGYVTVDLRTAYHINKNWLISAKLNNLLDKQYHTVNNYNTADRNFFVSIQYNN